MKVRGIMITEKQVINYLNTKDKTYIDHLVKSLELDTPIVSDSNTKECPICGSISFKKNGKDSNGNQRYFCHDCHHTFNDKIGTFLHWSHMTIEQWKKFIDYEIAKVKLKDEAHFLGVSITTCFSCVTNFIMPQQKLSINKRYLKM